jgi:hypothetical protein
MLSVFQKMEHYILSSDLAVRNIILYSGDPDVMEQPSSSQAVLPGDRLNGHVTKKRP